MLVIYFKPDDHLNDYILNLKKVISKKFIRHEYNDHLPHCTILASNMLDKTNIIYRISNIMKDFKNLQFEITKADVFFNDLLTGGNTLFLKVKKNQKILNLQNKLANKLILPDNFVGEIPLEIKKNKLLYKSYKKYGYPFVGKHWIPHFSVSSLRVEKLDPVIKEFLALQKEFHFLVDVLSLWRVNGNKHTQLETVTIQ